MRPSLLVIVAKVTVKATLHATGLGGLWSVFEEMPELFKEVWTQWSGEVDTPEARRRDLEATTQAGDETIDQAIDDPSVQEALDQVPPEKRRDVARDARAVLKQIRANARHTFRRPDDPTGLTVPAALAPREAKDLIPILMARKPRFAKGDRPIAGLDWELEELLGMGGFGEVWKARHLHLSNEPRRALKFCNDPEAQARLRTVEAVICDRVRRRGHHPGIVRLIDTNLSADPPCLHFEYVEGGDLAGLVRQWKGQDRYPSHDLIAQAILRIAKPVAFAHTLDEQIVHRDLKPSNILVARSPDGKIRFKITDFGIGGMVNPNSAAKSRAGSLRSLTYLQAISGSGTPLYASPEQMKGDPVSPTDDVHALGVIWYQLLIGDLTEGRPGGDGWKEDLAEQGMPEPLIRLLGSCFEKAKRRPANAQEFIESLERHLAPSPAEVSTQVGSAIADQPEDISTPFAHPNVEKRSAIADPTLHSYVNSLDMTMMRIEPGEFLMGSTQTQIDKLLKLYPDATRGWFDSEQPQHKVTITRPFHLARHLVTVGQFRRFVDAKGYKSEAEQGNAGSYGWDGKAWNIDPKKNWRNPGFPQGDDHPVVCVSHNDALAFIDWLNKQETRDGRGYRLPTEAEWEYACRAGTGGLYGGTDDPETLVRVANVADASLKKVMPTFVCFKGDDGFAYTSPVGSFEPNEWGLRDMIGNVWEWCDDWYEPKFYQSSPEKDPRNETKATSRVYRGGCWLAHPGRCRPARRERDSPEIRDFNLGFRLAAVR